MKKNYSFKKERTLLGVLFSFFSYVVLAQVTISPASFDADTEITITFDATGTSLNGYTGEVYMYSGIHTLISTWQYVKPCNWGDINEREKMTRTGTNTYEITITPRSYYRIPVGETIDKLAFVFRDNKPALQSADIIYDLTPNALVNTLSVSVTKQADESLQVIFPDGGKVRYIPYSSELLKVEYAPRGEESYTSMSVDIIPGAMSATLDSSNPTDYIYSFANKEVRINKSNFNTSYYEDGILVTKEIGGFNLNCAERTSSLQLVTGEQIYGLGSKGVLNQNRRGKTYDMYNKQTFGYPQGALETNDLNISIPFVVSNKNYGIYYDHEYGGTADIGSSISNELIYKTSDGTLSYFLVFGSNYDEIIENYTTLTGKQPLPPRWALGYIQSRYGYENETQSRQIVNDIKAQGFPMDGLVLDLFWFGGTTQMGKLDWDYSRFPTPSGMMSDFKNLGVKTIVITEPYITDATSNWNFLNTNKYMALDKDGNTKNVTPLNMKWLSENGDDCELYGTCLDVGVLDVTKQTALDWMWNFYDGRIGEGVEGFWCDLGEPEHNHGVSIEEASETMFQGESLSKIHNRYALRWEKMLYDKYQANYPTKRVFNLNRSGNAGMQRYGAIPWSGDVQGSEKAFKLQIPIMLGMGLSGVGYMHTDAGGFQGHYETAYGYNYSYNQVEDLYTRWAQYACFTPVVRFHANNTGFGFEPEPIYHRDVNIIKDFIKIRYDLLPYNYTLAFENSLFGVPLARPMNYYENTTALSNVNDQYFWGENFIIAPILNLSATSRNVKTPSGTWYDYWDNSVTYPANSTVSINAPMSKMPILIKEGSFITKSLGLDSTDDYDSSELDITYFPSTSASTYTMYNDDGADATSISSGNYETITMNANPDGLKSVFTFNSSGDYTGGKPMTRGIIFHTFDLGQPVYVLSNNSRLTSVASYALMETTLESYYYDSTNNTLDVNTAWTTSGELKIEFKTCNSSSTWNGSWSNGIPDASTYAVISGTYDFSASSPQGDLNACACTIDNQNIVVSDGKYMKVDSDINLINGATITVEHGGNLVQVDDNAVVPSALIKTQTRAINNHTWVHRSSPINNSVADVLALIPFGSYVYDSAGQPQNEYRAGQVYVLNQTGWQTVNDDTEMIPGRGFILRTTGQRFSSTFPVNLNNLSLQSRLMDFGGEVNNGTYEVPLHSDGNAGANIDYNTAGQDQNLVGNPYPSAIDADLFLNENTDIDGYVRFWTSPMIGINGNYPHSTGFATYNGTMAVPSGTDPLYTPSKYIAPGQGFSVYSTCADCTGKNITFTNAMRVTTETGGRTFARQEDDNKPKVWLSMKDGNTDLVSRIGVGYVEKSTKGFDRIYDANALVTDVYKFYSFVEDQKMTINGNGTFSKDDKIELGFDLDNNNERMLEINLDNLQGFEENQDIILHDKLLGVYQKLNQSSYRFVFNEESSKDRFELVYQEQEQEPKIYTKTLVAIQDAILKVEADKQISKVKVHDVVGRFITSIDANDEYEISSRFERRKDIYLVQVLFTDGTQQVVKVYN
ncbi:MAG: hypothetical protein H6604_06800 [Flavobacteriales bacterium]|nr:hypothetical protein [Flavobacteriales bacterium]